MNWLFAFGLPAAPEWTFLALLALILFGPSRLPDLARGAARLLAQLHHAKEEFQRELLQLPPLPKIEEPPGKRALDQASLTIPSSTQKSLEEKEFS